MDCVACGKPISITAKFCGKCGAPVKRSAKPVEAAVSEDTVATAAAPLETHLVDELTFTLSPPEHMAGMRDIDLDLKPIATEPALAPPPAATPDTPPVVDASLKPNLPSIDHEKLKTLEQTQQEIKKTLEKHSLLLDFISLASQQQSHQQTQPDPLEPLIHQVAEQQNSLQSQLTQLAALLSQNEVQQHSQRMPDEFKLQLEKQKIELHKLIAQSLAQGLAQSTENLQDAEHEALEQLEKRLENYHQAAQQSLEKNMGTLAAGMSELKTQVQAIQKKTAEKSTARTASSSDDDSDGGSFMIFVIGLLCGLTVVLSSLAIYNFLSHEPSKTEAAGKADKHDSGDHAEATDKHATPAADKHEEPSDKHGATDDKHEAPAKTKSH
jgi:hypothetical protein